MFKDRTQAGKQLAEKLTQYKDNCGVLVLAIPRGGVPVAIEVAKHLRAELSLLVARKLPYPNNPESDFGAIAEDGSTILLRGGISNLTGQMITSIINNQKDEINRQIQILRSGKPLSSIENRIVILVDDGITMGSKMLASLMMCQKKKPEKTIIAAPVASPEVTRALSNNASVNEIVILKSPKFFKSIAQIYETWHNIPDHKVISMLREFDKNFQAGKSSV